jgi:hypothetical protein
VRADAVGLPAHRPVDRTLMESVFPAADLVTVDDAVLAPAVPHARTRMLLRDVGVPDRCTGWFQAGDLSARVAVKGCRQRGSELFPDLAFAFDQWICLGGIPYDDIWVDARTGVVHCTPDSGAAPCVINSSLDLFLWFLCRLEAERPNYDAEYAESIGLPDDDENWGEGVAARLAEEFRAADPVALENPASTWHLVLGYVETCLD